MRLGIGVLAAFVVMLGAGEAQAQRKREVIVLEMDVADLRAEIMRIARDEAGEVSVELEPRERRVTSIVAEEGRPSTSMQVVPEDLRRALGLRRARTIVGDTLEIEKGKGVETPVLMDALQRRLPGFDVSLRLDGTIAATLTDKGLARRLLSAMRASEAVIERRLEAAGVGRASVEAIDGMRLEMSLPTGTDEGLIETLTARGAVSFHLVATDRDPADFESGVAKGGLMTLLNEYMGEEQVIQLMPIVAVGEIATAEASFDDYGRPSISFNLTGSGRIKFARATSQNVGRPFAIVLDGAIISAPVINSPITEGKGQISGSFTMEEADLLAASISGGALPARLVIVERRIDPPQ
jgi:protein-export membrane protein SecD